MEYFYDDGEPVSPPRQYKESPKRRFPMLILAVLAIIASGIYVVGAHNPANNAAPQTPGQGEIIGSTPPPTEDITPETEETPTEEEDQPTEEDTPDFPSGYREEAPTTVRDLESEKSASTHKIVKLPEQKIDGKIGNRGVLPGTEIAVVTSRSGGSVRYEKCTVAFSLAGSHKSSYAITAGHCGKKGQQVYTLPKGSTFNSSSYLGIVSYSSRANYEKGQSDWAAIRLSKSSYAPSVKANVPMRLDLGNRPIGSMLCKTGATTGIDCGKKTLNKARATIGSFSSNGTKITGEMDGARICALPGDSGGPVYDKSGIVGVVSSTTATQDEVNRGSCDSGTSLFYSPVSMVISQVKKKVPSVIVNSK